MQNARPVIISDQTPWSNLQAKNVGFDIDLNDKTTFVNAIQKLCLMNQLEYDKMNTSSLNYINQKLNIQEIKNQYLNLFA